MEKLEVYFRERAGRFDKLVEQGAYDNFQHSSRAVEFVGRSIINALSKRWSQKSVKILDFGCGDGQWLSLIGQIAAESSGQYELYGCDISERMLCRAKERVRSLGINVHLALIESPFPLLPIEIDTEDFDVIFLYDVLQQFPMRRQFMLCDALIRRLNVQGTLLVFDHDMLSPYGLTRTARKLLTRHVGIPLLPEHQCYAYYPCLGRIANKLERSQTVSGISKRYEPNIKKYSLEIVRARGADQS